MGAIIVLLSALFIVCIISELLSYFVYGWYIPSKHSDRICEYIGDYRLNMFSRSILSKYDKPYIYTHYMFYGCYYIEGVGVIKYFSKAHYAIKNKFKYERSNLKKCDKYSKI